MYEIIKNKIVSTFTLKRVIIGVLSILLIGFACSLIGGYLDTRADYQRTREQLERTQRALDESRKLNQLNALKAINEKQGQELTKASNLLTTQEAKLNEASTSLDELKEQIKRNKRTEQRLKRQRTIWGVVAGVVTVAAAVK